MAIAESSPAIVMLPPDAGTQQVSKPVDWASTCVVAEVIAIDLGGATVGGVGASVEDDAAVPEQVTLSSLPPSLKELKSALKNSVEVSLTLGELYASEGWAALLKALTAEDYGAAVGAADLDYEQVLAARTLAVNLAQGCSCDHLAYALRKAREHSRRDIIMAVAPLCVDRESNSHLVLAVMTEWERVCCSSALS